jgi:hypothetical protein
MHALLDTAGDDVKGTGNAAEDLKLLRGDGDFQLRAADDGNGGRGLYLVARGRIEQLGHAGEAGADRLGDGDAGRAVGALLQLLDEHLGVRVDVDFGPLEEGESRLAGRSGEDAVAGLERIAADAGLAHARGGALHLDLRREDGERGLGAELGIDRCRQGKCHHLQQHGHHG